MAGPGGTNEIVVRIVSGLKGGAAGVVDEAKKKAKAAGDAEVKEKEATEKRKEAIAEKALARQRKLLAKVREDDHRARMDFLKSEDKFETSLSTRKRKRAEESYRDEIKRQKEAHKTEMALFNERLAISKKAKAASDRVRRREETEARQAAAKAERESPNYIRRQGYMAARRRDIAARGKIDYLYDQGKPLPGTAEYYEQKGYEGAAAAQARKAGKARFMTEQGIVPAAKAAKAPRVPLTYAQRRARATAEREEYLTQMYGSPREGRFAQRQAQSDLSIEAAKDQRRIMFRRVLTGDTGRVGISPSDMFKKGMAPQDQLKNLTDLAGSNPVLFAIKKLINWSFKPIAAAVGIGYAQTRKGVEMNRSFGRAQAELAGMEDLGPNPAQFNIRSRRYGMAAAMGRSPKDLLQARIASLKGAGGGVSDIETLALMVNSQMGAGDAAQMMSMSMMRGNRGADIKKDVNRTFAIGVAAGFKEIARQPIFAKSFAEYLSKGHVAGATREGAGSLLAAFTKAAPGGAISGLYGLDLIDKLQAGMTGPSPQSAMAAFQRYLIGYGRPGSSMDFFKAEDIRAGGIHERPELVKNILQGIRGVTRGSDAQSRFMLRNVFGLTQPQAKEFLKTGDIAPVPELGEDKFSAATAAARTPMKAKRYAKQDVDLMRATTNATAAFDHFADVATNLAKTNEGVIVKVVKAVSTYLTKYHVAEEYEGKPMPTMPSAAKRVKDMGQNVKNLQQEEAALRSVMFDPRASDDLREKATQRYAQVQQELLNAKVTSARSSVAAGLERSVGPAIASQIYPSIAPSEETLGKARGQFNARGIESRTAGAIFTGIPGLELMRTVVDGMGILVNQVKHSERQINEQANALITFGQERTHDSARKAVIERQGLGGKTLPPTK